MKKSILIDELTSPDVANIRLETADAARCLVATGKKAVSIVRDGHFWCRLVNTKPSSYASIARTVSLHQDELAWRLTYELAARSAKAPRQESAEECEEREDYSHDSVHAFEGGIPSLGKKRK